ncbi:MAG: glycosyl transferase [Clostridia bacterium]|nr:glycosyl transferase [Clostridia bacterium]
MSKSETKTKEVLKDLKTIEKLAEKQWDTKIPKIIHYMWVGNNPKSEEILKNIESWKKLNPDFEIIEWNENNFDLNYCQFIKDALSNKKYAFVADWVRLYAINKLGGIWLDTDVEVIKPFGELMNLDGFISFENEAYLETAIMAGKKGSQWINTLYKFYTNRSFYYKNEMDLTPNTVINSIFLKKFYNMKYKNKLQVIENELTIFPSDYFAPKDYTTGIITTTENTVAIHNFSGSWMSKNANKQQKFLRFIRKIFGKKIFGCFTRLYIKSVEKRYLKEYKQVVGEEK